MNTAGVFRTEEGVTAPKRATGGSAGYDFYAPETVTIEPHSTVEFDSKVKAYIRDGIVLKMYVRSSLGRKGLTLTNSVGIIDSDYTDNIHAFLINNSDKPITIEKGDRYMQGIFLPYFITDDDEAEGVRNGGMGSTGK